MLENVKDGSADSRLDASTATLDVWFRPLALLPLIAPADTPPRRLDDPSAASFLKRLADFHARIQRQRRETSAAFGRFGMSGGYGEVRAGAIDGVGVAVALGSRHSERAGGDELVERNTLPILGYVQAFALADLQQIAFDAGESDLLLRSGAGGAHRPVLQVHVIEAKNQGRSHGQDS